MVELEELLNNPHARKRLDLIIESAKKTRDLSPEEMLIRGIQLIEFSKANLFTLKE